MKLVVQEIMGKWLIEGHRGHYKDLVIGLMR